MENYREGKVIIGICYFIGLRKYFVVMIRILEWKIWKWFDDIEVV